MSDFYPDDVLDGNFTPAEQKARRLEEICVWFAAFENFCFREGEYRVQWIDDASNTLNQIYWEQMNEAVRPRIVSSSGRAVRADRHKIAALMELLVVNQELILDDNPEIQSDINARLALYIATNIIGNWNADKVGDMYVSDSFDREHTTWLKQLNLYTEGWPVFSNAATWYLVELIYFERQQKAAS
jgi:hypothetical protein